MPSSTVPIPDPTVLTTQQLIRELAATRELIEARLDGMDKALVLLQAQADKMPSVTDLAFSRLQEVIDMRLTSVGLEFAARDKAMEAALLAQKEALAQQTSNVLASVGRLQELHNAKFEGIAVQFRERDIRTEQASRDNKVAIDAALQAQKEAVSKQNESNSQAIAKSEATFIKQIDQIGTLIATMAKGTEDKINDIKDRLTTIEGLKKGANDVWVYLVAGVGLALALAALLLKR